MATTPTSSERPRQQVDIVGWLRQNLFNSWFNSIVTVLVVVLLALLLRSLLVWAFTQAEWGVVEANFRRLMVGNFPQEQTWRVWLCVVLACSLIGLSRGFWPDVIGGVAPVYGVALLLLALLPFATSNRVWLVLCSGLIFAGWPLGRWLAAREASNRWSNLVGMGWVVLLPVVLVLLYGLPPLLPMVATQRWGGLLLTFVLAITGILFSFPLGVLLAIGRRSNLPAVSGFCTVYIEVFRGVPLVTVLFMFLIMLPLFIPGAETSDNIVRAIVGFTLFTAAYIAENVRGGLQSIPKGQVEAATALGLNPVLTMVFIILPQALRIVIPANVNQFVSLFKDTSLVIVAGGGMLELLGIARNAANQTEFLGSYVEAMGFAALLYWIFCFSMTYVSRRLEDRLNVGHR
jgi:general L-amino acid transport system permease protein